MIARPSGWSPKTASPSTSKTFSCGLVLVHRDLLEHDLALGFDVGERRREDHVGHHVERARQVAVEHAGVDRRRLLARAGVELGAHRVEDLVDLLASGSARCRGTAGARAGGRGRPPARAPRASRCRPRSPSATERTAGMASVTTRTPDGVSVSRCSAATRRAVAPARAPPRAVRVAVARAAALAAAAAPAAVTAVAAAAAAVAARAAVAAAARPAVARRRRGELLDRLAGDVGVVGEAQPDAAALAVDLDHAHLDLVALVEHVLDRVDALARARCWRCAAARRCPWRARRRRRRWSS